MLLEPGFTYDPARNRGFHVTQQTCWPEVRESKFLSATDGQPVKGRDFKSNADWQEFQRTGRYRVIQTNHVDKHHHPELFEITFTQENLNK